MGNIIPPPLKDPESIRCQICKRIEPDVKKHGAAMLCDKCFHQTNIDNGTEIAKEEGLKAKCNKCGTEGVFGFRCCHEYQFNEKN